MQNYSMELMASSMWLDTRVYPQSDNSDACFSFGGSFCTGTVSFVPPFRILPVHRIKRSLSVCVGHSFGSDDIIKAKFREYLNSTASSLWNLSHDGKSEKSLFQVAKLSSLKCIHAPESLGSVNPWWSTLALISLVTLIVFFVFLSVVATTIALKNTSKKPVIRKKTQESKSSRNDIAGNVQLTPSTPPALFATSVLSTSSATSTSSTMNTISDVAAEPAVVNLVPVVLDISRRAKFQKAIMKSCNITENINSMFDSNIDNENRFKFIDGLRVLSLLGVIRYHLSDKTVMDPQNYSTFSNTLANTIRQSDLMVDTFFVIGGAMAMMSSLRELAVHNQRSWLLFFVRRICRLLPVMTLNVLLGMAVGFQQCANFGWANLLGIQNLVPNKGMLQCNITAWYIAVDWQLYVLLISTSPMIVQRFNWKTAFIANSVVAMLCTLAYFIFSYQLKAFTLTGHLSSLYWTASYQQAWSRAPAYIIGMNLAILVYHRHRSNFSRRLLVQVSGFAVAVGLLSLAALLPVTNSAFDLESNTMKTNTWTDWQHALYTASCRPVWSLGIAILCYFMALDSFSLLRQFLSAALWQPFARVSYFVYLFHFLIVQHFNVVPMHNKNFLHSCTFAVSAYFFLFCLAAPVYVFVELPCTKMAKHFFKRTPAPCLTGRENVPLINNE